MSEKNSFKKNERVKSKKEIEFLLKSGLTKTFFPIKVYVCLSRSGSNVKFMSIVPKKKIPSSVVRNRVKRVMREVWRINKNTLISDLKNLPAGINVGFLYLDKEPPTFDALNKKMHSIIGFIIRFCENNKQEIG